MLHFIDEMCDDDISIKLTIYGEYNIQDGTQY